MIQGAGLSPSLHVASIPVSVRALGQQVQQALHQLQSGQPPTMHAIEHELPGVLGALKSSQDTTERWAIINVMGESLLAFSRHGHHVFYPDAIVKAMGELTAVTEIPTDMRLRVIHYLCEGAILDPSHPQCHRDSDHPFNAYGVVSMGRDHAIWGETLPVCMQALLTIANTEGEFKQYAIDTMAEWLTGPYRHQVMTIITNMNELPAALTQYAVPRLVQWALMPGNQQKTAVVSLLELSEIPPLNPTLVSACFKALAMVSDDKAPLQRAFQLVFRLAGLCGPAFTQQVGEHYHWVMANPLFSSHLKQEGITQLFLHVMMTTHQCDPCFITLIHDLWEADRGHAQLINHALLWVLANGHEHGIEADHIQWFVHRFGGMRQQYDMATQLTRLVMSPRHHHMVRRLLDQLIPTPTHPFIMEMVTKCAEKTAHDTWVTSMIMVLVNHAITQDATVMATHMDTLLAAHPQPNVQPLMAMLYQEAPPYPMQNGIIRVIKKATSHTLLMSILRQLHTRDYAHQTAATRILIALKGAAIPHFDTINQASILHHSHSIPDLITVIKPDKAEHRLMHEIMWALFNPNRTEHRDGMQRERILSTLHAQLGHEPLTLGLYDTMQVLVRLHNEPTVYQLQGVLHWLKQNGTSPVTRQHCGQSDYHLAHYPMILWRLIKERPVTDMRDVLRAWHELPEDAGIKRDAHVTVIMDVMGTHSPFIVGE